MTIQEQVTGRLPVVFPITTQDITPYSNDVYRLNAKEYSAGKCAFYDEEELHLLRTLYGSMDHL